MKALIEDKGDKSPKIAEPEDTNVVDLMSALRASLAAKDKGQAKWATKENAKEKTSKGSLTKPRARKASYCLALSVLVAMARRTCRPHLQSHFVPRRP